MRGLVTVTKVFKDGKRERILEDSCNVLTGGFGISITSMLSTGPTELADRFHFKYFQVGVSGYHQDLPQIITPALIDHSEWAYSLPLATHNKIYELSSALTSESSYGSDGDIELVTKEVLTVTNPFSPQESLNYTTSSLLLAKLPYHPTTNLTDKSVNTKITIDRESLNGISIKEFGLFSENPEGLFIPRPVLSAYKSLPEPIVKTAEFSLDVEWIIQLDPAPLKSSNNYYDVWDLFRIGDVLRFYPSVKSNSASFYLATVDKNTTYDILIESTTPTPHDGHLSYSLQGNAVSGVHYLIDSSYASPLFVPKGATLVTIPVSAIDTSGYYNSTTRLDFHMDSFTGGMGIPKVLRDSTPPNFMLYFKSSNNPPVVELGVDNTGASSIVSGLLDTSCLDTVSVYLEFSSNGAIVVEDPSSLGGATLLSSITSVVSGVILTIPVSSTSGTVIVSGSSPVSVEVSSYNIVSGPPTIEYNKFAHSNNFENEAQPSSFVSIQDITDHAQDLLVTNNRWWRENIGAGRFYHPGYPTLKTHSGNDTYSNNPPQELYAHSYTLPNIKAPDGVQAATLSYATSAIYIWPENKTLNKANYASTGQPKPVNSPPKIRRSYSTFETDSLNRGIDRESQTMEYNSAMSSIVLSMYVKRLPSAEQVTHPMLKESSMVDTNELVHIELYSRGFKETTNTLIPGSAGAGCWATFKWNPSGGLELTEVSAVNNKAFDDADLYLSAGCFSGIANDVAKYGYQDSWAGRDGWYRVYLAAEIPVTLTDAATNANLNYDGSGAVSQFFMFPTCSGVKSDAGGIKLPGYTASISSAPSVLSGTVHAWAQYEETLKTGTTYGSGTLLAQGKVPRVYQPRVNDFWEPLGNVFLSPTTGKQKVTVSF